MSALISRLRRQLPPRGSLLQESFRTTQQGDEREQYCPPSSVAYGDSPPRGSLFTKFLSHYTTRRRMRANRKGKPQHKMIFAISAMFTTSAMFAQCKEGFPSGGKKTASSLSRKRLMRGDKSALMKDTLPTRPHQTSATAAHCKKSLPPETQKTSPKSTRTVQSKTNLCPVQAGALGGSSR